MSPKQKKTILKDLLIMQKLAAEQGLHHAREYNRYIANFKMITERIKALKGGKE